ncbi:uncharacterized protein LOC124126528 [Haliotis rufescens]|uniref:uncharacterized protein LOC124126528 n=1 Tax=Haliotis rufescens TaxID=6454 RepID=UPI00201EF09F|nr:uncharacterized protein LOC124126528 [Haliotis rufescens]
MDGKKCMADNVSNTKTTVSRGVGPSPGGVVGQGRGIRTPPGQHFYTHVSQNTLPRDKPRNLKIVEQTSYTCSANSGKKLTTTGVGPSYRSVYRTLQVTADHLGEPLQRMANTLREPRSILRQTRPHPPAALTTQRDKHHPGGPSTTHGLLTPQDMRDAVRTQRPVALTTQRDKHHPDGPSTTHGLLTPQDMRDAVRTQRPVALTTQRDKHQPGGSSTTHGLLTPQDMRDAVRTQRPVALTTQRDKHHPGGPSTTPGLLTPQDMRDAVRTQRPVARPRPRRALGYPSPVVASVTHGHSHVQMKVKPTVSMPPISVQGAQYKGQGQTERSQESHGGQRDALRHIVIDGCNAAYSHGHHSTFSGAGIHLAAGYFLRLGHTVAVVLPQTCKKRFRKLPLPDQERLKRLEESGVLVYTPTRSIHGRYVQHHEERWDTSSFLVSSRRKDFKSQMLQV